MVETDVDAMWFLPSALNVKVKKFNQARVNGGSNYDSLKVAKCLVINNKQQVTVSCSVTIGWVLNGRRKKKEKAAINLFCPYL